MTRNQLILLAAGGSAALLGKQALVAASIGHEIVLQHLRKQ